MAKHSQGPQPSPHPKPGPHVTNLPERQRLPCSPAGTRISLGMLSSTSPSPGGLQAGSQTPKLSSARFPISPGVVHASQTPAPPGEVRMLPKRPAQVPRALWAGTATPGCCWQLQQTPGSPTQTPPLKHASSPRAGWQSFLGTRAHRPCSCSQHRGSRVFSGGCTVRRAHSH